MAEPARLTELDIAWDSEGLRANLDDVARRQLPFAIALTLTRVAQAVRAAEVAEMNRVFDRPTPFTLRSLYLTAASKRDASPRAEVYFKDLRVTGPGHYLEPQVYGGTRPAKRFEQRLRAAGVIASDEFLVPGERVPKDKYGNPKPGQIVKMLADLRALNPGDNTKNATAGVNRWFVGVPGQRRTTIGTARGIYRRTPYGLDPWFLITKAPNYKPIFQFFEVAQRVAQAHTKSEFAKALAEALATSTQRSARRFEGGRARGLFERRFGGGAG